MNRLKLLIILFFGRLLPVFAQSFSISSCDTFYQKIGGNMYSDTLESISCYQNNMLVLFKYFDKGKVYGLDSVLPDYQQKLAPYQSFLNQLYGREPATPQYVIRLNKNMKVYDSRYKPLDSVYIISTPHINLSSISEYYPIDNGMDNELPLQDNHSRELYLGTSFYEQETLGKIKALESKFVLEAGDIVWEEKRYKFLKSLQKNCIRSHSRIGMALHKTYFIQLFDDKERLRVEYKFKFEDKSEVDIGNMLSAIHKLEKFRIVETDSIKLNTLNHIRNIYYYETQNREWKVDSYPFDYEVFGCNKEETQCTSFYPKFAKNGQWTYYYPNGQRLVSGKFKAGKEVGQWKFYYENGKLATIYYYSSNGHLLHKKNVNLLSP